MDKRVHDCLYSLRYKYGIVPFDSASINIGFFIPKIYNYIKDTSISKNPGNPTYTNTSFSKEEIQFGKSQVMHVINEYSN